MLLALADQDGSILSTGFGGGVNAMDNPGWRDELSRCLEPFRLQDRLVSVAAALPVYGEVAEISSLLEDVVSHAFPNARTRVLNDVDAAHLGAFAGEPGILLLSGTGSMAWGRNLAGRSYRVGGWGDIIGDEGSSHWIGRLALSVVSQSIDGRTAETALTGAVFKHLGLDRTNPMESLGSWAATKARRSSIAALAEVVDTTAAAGDETSFAILEMAADQLARHHSAITEHCEPNAKWTYAGGTFKSRLLLDALARRIGRPPVRPSLPPIGGALFAAAQLLDWPTDEGWIERVARTAKAAFEH
jgi:N-acetylglucosamine kinase-like BadF-type ATPase